MPIDASAVIVCMRSGWEDALIAASAAFGAVLALLAVVALVLRGRG